jgi:hypothetical protein
MESHLEIKNEEQKDPNNAVYSTSNVHHFDSYREPIKLSKYVITN